MSECDYKVTPRADYECSFEQIMHFALELTRMRLGLLATGIDAERRDEHLRVLATFDEYDSTVSARLRDFQEQYDNAK